MSLHQPDMFLPRPVQVAMDNADKFPDDFLHWLPANQNVFEAFAREAKKIIKRGFSHYSAKTIIEFLRHHSALHQTEPETEWKINNNYAPYLARLFDLVYPGNAGLFEYRITKKVHTPEELVSA